VDLHPDVHAGIRSRVRIEQVQEIWLSVGDCENMLST